MKSDSFNSNSFSDSVYDQPVILEKPAYWTQIFVWAIVSVTGFGLLWATFAQIEQAVPAAGKLEPQQAPQDVRPAAGGVVREVLVKEGELVKRGEVLLTLDPTSSQADVESLRNVKESLLKENQFYDKAVNGETLAAANTDLETLTRERLSLVGDNDVYQALLNEFDLGTGGGGGGFSATQQALFLANRREYLAIQEQEQAQIRNLNEKLNEIDGQLAAGVERLIRSREQMPRAQNRLSSAQAQLAKAQDKLVTDQQVLTINEEILGQINPLVDEGALSKLQQQRQQQEVLTKQGSVISATAELDTLRGEIEARQREILQTQDEVTARQAEVDRLRSQQDQVRAEIDVARKDADSKRASWMRNMRDKLQTNKQRIAQVDSQIGQKKQENSKQISQIEGQLTKAQQALQYQEVKAPVDGFVFDLKASPGFVAREVDQNPMMKLIPQDSLIAKVYINNKDITLVQPGMDVEINVEAYPSMQFGTIKGKLKSIGSDALSPVPNERPFYAFPAEVELPVQAFELNGKEYPIQSGMAIQGTIKIGKRTVMEMFLDSMSRKVKTLETVK
ncbi:HlyD family secretion protein [Ancylothrix sp. C2]|uniref:HlyD family secretion protein n=1 Tax=Ancylothrix sp. D3o TaxID=2953691 RepID=UPI0021BA45B7|nr:HlyD family secretion protein [Ancylothrix sp. D3o]MCT7949174.1 HlyD family secretion protein [Ancylothrix sp. D3o]